MRPNAPCGSPEHDLSVMRVGFPLPGGWSSRPFTDQVNWPQTASDISIRDQMVLRMAFPLSGGWPKLKRRDVSEVRLRDIVCRSIGLKLRKLGEWLEAKGGVVAANAAA